MTCMQSVQIHFCTAQTSLQKTANLNRSIFSVLLERLRASVTSWKVIVHPVGQLTVETMYRDTVVRDSFFYWFIINCIARPNYCLQRLRFER